MNYIESTKFRSCFDRTSKCWSNCCWYLGCLSEIHLISLQHMVTLCDMYGNSSNSCDCYRSWSQSNQNQSKTVCDSCGKITTPCSCSPYYTGHRGNIQHTAIMCDYCHISTEYWQCDEDSQKDEAQQTEDPDISLGKLHKDNTRRPFRIHEDGMWLPHWLD